MFPRNNATPPELAIGEVRLVADGALQSTGVLVRVKPEGGAWAAGDGDLNYDATSGLWSYVPTQAETNATAFIVAIYKANCTGSSVTVVTSAASTAGQVVTDTASREASKATGFATPDNVTDAAAAIILQGNEEWATATSVVATNMLTEAAIASQVRTELGVELGRIDAAISTRSTYAGADTAGTTTLLTRVAGTIAAGTHNPQTGDAFARIGANGAGLTALATSVAIAAAMAEIEKVPRVGTTHTWTNTDTSVAATVAITEAGP